MSRFVEPYYSIPKVAWIFELGESTVRRKGKAGEFGAMADCLVDGNQVRIPHSGLLFYREKHRIKDVAQKRLDDQVRGRTLGEARRRLKEATSPDA